MLGLESHTATQGGLDIGSVCLRDVGSLVLGDERAFSETSTVLLKRGDGLLLSHVSLQFPCGWSENNSKR